MEKTIERQNLDMDLIATQKEDELFYFVKQDTNASERITAPRYSYWKSVFRVFFRKKTNWVILILLALLVLMSMVFPLIFKYNEFENITEPGAASFNLNPVEAIKLFGFNIKWIFQTINKIWLPAWKGSIFHRFFGYLLVLWRP